MVICHYYQKPDILLTMTENTNWPEIQEQLLKDDAVPGRPQKRQEASG